MPRISLVEAYNNRDVIAWLVKHQDAIDEMMNILQNINPDGDLTNIVLKTGDQTIDGVKTFIGQIVADCDIIQNGAAYETHAEQIFSKNDYMIMRDGALNGLAAGTYSGLQVKKYNGSDDARMVIDNTGIMRVGDINDERPIMVRDEAADLNAGDVLLWDSVDQKAIGQAKDAVPTSGSSACVESDGIYTALAAKADNTALASKADVTPVQHYPTLNTVDFTGGDVVCFSFGKLVMVSMRGITPLSTGDKVIVTGLPACSSVISSHTCLATPGGIVGNMWMDVSGTTINLTVGSVQLFWQTFWYFME